MNKKIITGQQIGLLGGPLYTTFKVLGAIKLASEVNGESVYWLETNDADFNEINHIEYLDSNDELRSLKWDKDTKGYSCGSIEIDGDLVELLDRFFETIRQTEFTQELHKIVSECYKTGRTLGEASEFLAESMFRGRGIEIFNPHDQHFRDTTREILLNEAKRTAHGKQCNLFCIIEKRRVAVFRDKNGFSDRSGKKIDLEKYELTPNFRTRNVCQDSYFKTHTYVAGPGEIEYIKDLDEMYKFHNVVKPEIKKRMSVTLIEPRVKRILKKLEFNLSDFIEEDKDSFKKKYIKKTTGIDSKNLFKEAGALTDNYLKELRDLGIDVKDLRKYLLNSLKTSIGLKRASEKERIADSIRKIDFVFNSLNPFGRRQERIFNVFYYMNLYGGLSFINWLYKNYNTKMEFLEILND